MEITRETTCPTPRCGKPLVEWSFDEPPITVMSCTACELDGVLGDDRLLAGHGLENPEIRSRLRKRATRVKEWAEEAAKRFTDVK